MSPSSLYVRENDTDLFSPENSQKNKGGQKAQGPQAQKQQGGKREAESSDGSLLHHQLPRATAPGPSKGTVLHPTSQVCSAAETPDHDNQPVAFCAPGAPRFYSAIQGCEVSFWGGGEDVRKPRRQV